MQKTAMRKEPILVALTEQEKADAAELARTIRTMRVLWTRGGRSAAAFSAGLRQVLSGNEDKIQ